jgi:nitroreductase
MDLFDAMYTLRAVRYFRPDPVPDDLIRQVLDAAIRAPSGGNSQPWAWVVLKDAGLRSQVADYYRRAFDAGYGARTEPEPDPTRRRVRRSALHLSEHMGEIPVLILACIRHGGAPAGMIRGSSIYPAVQNLMLAARSFGLGTVLTTIHLAYDQEVKGLLGIPADVDVAALIPLGYPARANAFGATTRRPVEEMAFLDTWGAPLS